MNETFFYQRLKYYDSDAIAIFRWNKNFDSCHECTVNLYNFGFVPAKNHVFIGIKIDGTLYPEDEQFIKDFQKPGTELQKSTYGSYGFEFYDMVLCDNWKDIVSD